MKMVFGLTLMVAALACSGCLLMAAGAGGTAGVRELTDKSIVYRGDINAAENAVRKTISDMGAVIKEETRESGAAGDLTFRGKTFDEVPMTIDCEPTTPSTTRIEVRVGRIGSKDRAREVHAVIQKYLKPVEGQD